MIRPLTAADIPALEVVQNRALPGSLPAAFSPRFFRLYYESLMEDRRFLSSGFFSDSWLAGFLIYSPDSAGLVGSALRKRLIDFGSVVAASVLARPARLRTVARILPAVLVPGAQPGGDVRAELLSFGVLPEFRRGSLFYAERRIHVALDLLHAAFAALSAAGSARVKIFIQTEDRNPFINEFYRREGFRFVSRAKRMGVLCNYCVRDLP